VSDSSVAAVSDGQPLQNSATPLRKFSYRPRTHILVYLLVSLVFCSGRILAEVPVEDLASREKAAFADYGAGNITSTITQLSALVPKARRGGVTYGYINLYSELVDVCIEAEDAECIKEQIPRLLPDISEFAKSHPELQQACYLRTTYYIGVGALFRHDPNELQQALDKLLDSPAEFTPQVDYYVRRRLLAATINLLLDNRAKSELEIDRALSMILAIKNPREHAVEIARWLSQAIAVLTAIGDQERARGLLLASSGFLGSVFRPTTLGVPCCKSSVTTKTQSPLGKMH
jgi:hypothetical protein